MTEETEDAMRDRAYREWGAACVWNASRKMAELLAQEDKVRSAESALRQAQRAIVGRSVFNGQPTGITLEIVPFESFLDPRDVIMHHCTVFVAGTHAFTFSYALSKATIVAVGEDKANELLVSEARRIIANGLEIVPVMRSAT